jgi:hypothetical protein
MIRKTRSGFAAAAFGLAMVANGLYGLPASADVPAGAWTPSSNPSSDPFITLCTTGGTSGLCLYTSQDMTAAGDPQSTGNYYPMDHTHLYFLPAGADPGGQWTDGGSVLAESQYPWVPGDPNGPVQYRTNHLWAPTMHRGMDGFYYLFVPDVSDKTPSGQQTSSHIGVSKSVDPAGPFTYVGQLTLSGAPLAGYASDPSIMEVIGFGPPQDRVLTMVYADGANTTCGGISEAQLDLDMTDLLTAPTQLSIAGLPAGLDGCDTSSGVHVGHAYMEGPELYDMSDTAGSNPMVYPNGDRYLLIFAIKPTNTNAPGCSSSNEAIGYATASDPLGTLQSDGSRAFTYRGIIMCGSSTQWTNQASILGYRMPDEMADPRFILFYHDSATSGSIPQNRQVHAECLSITNSGVQTNVPRTTNFSYCMHTLAMPNQFQPFGLGY